MRRISTKQIAAAGVIAAAYTGLSLALSLTSFGAVQFRAAEALTLLPVLYPEAVLGVTLGCALTNAIGAATGANFLGMLDVLLGAAATLAAAALTRALRRYRFRGLAVLSALPPVLVNAAVIGGEWCYALTGGLAPAAFFAAAAQITAGQLIPCCVLGVLLVRLLERNNIRI